LRPSLAAGLLLTTLACTGGEPQPTDVVDDDCADYPTAAEPMTLGEPIAPYRWPQAVHADGRQTVLDLATVRCPDLGEIDWSPFDVLLFVSVPAW